MLRSIIVVVTLFTAVLSKLLMVQELFRHGARYPIYTGLDNYTTYALTGQLEGELTKQGKRMHYMLGKIIFGQYWQALELPLAYNSSQLYVKSTDVNRTIESVQSHLAGMLENVTQLKLDDAQADLSKPFWNDETQSPIVSPSGYVYIDEPSYQPMAVHVQLGGKTNMSEGDFLRNYSPANCPAQENWQKENQNSDLYKTVLNDPKISAAIDAFTKAFNLSQRTTLAKIAEYYDNYECNYYNNRPYLDIFTGQYSQEFDFMYVFDLYANLFLTDLQINTTVTPFLNHTVNNMRNIMKDPTREKLIIYSAHDTTVGNVLAGLRLTSANCVWDVYKNGRNIDCVSDYPQYTSNVIFELVSRDTDYAVRVKYNGKSMRLPFCNRQTECSFQQFESFVNRTMRDNYKVDCGLVTLPNTPDNPVVLRLIIALSVIGVVLVVAVTYMCISRNRERKKGEINTSLMTRTESNVL